MEVSRKYDMRVWGAEPTTVVRFLRQFLVNQYQEKGGKYIDVLMKKKRKRFTGKGRLGGEAPQKNFAIFRLCLLDFL